MPVTQICKNPLFLRWSFGILLWEMFTLGQTPYPFIPVQQLVEILTNCVRMEKPEFCPPEIYHIMLECWNENPKERSSFEVLHHKLQKLLQANVIEVRNDDKLIWMNPWQHFKEWVWCQRSFSRSCLKKTNRAQTIFNCEVNIYFCSIIKLRKIDIDWTFLKPF